MMFMHDHPAAFNFPKPDGQSKIQRCPLHFLCWLYALHMRKGERDIISCNNLQPFDIERNRVGLAGIKQLPSAFIGSESPRDSNGGGTSNIRKSGEWFARTSGIFFARTAAAHRSSKSLTALSFIRDNRVEPSFSLGVTAAR
jgi:hypothetical protein